ncbi:hypothetical protein DMB66_35370 [Actinoplanes sp. ATCC 53533]|nr:hypothetical protein DMB66_35370 [Actinoplanes sp. ATCC 53533]
MLKCCAVRRGGVLLRSCRVRNTRRRGEARCVQRAVLLGEQRRPEQQRVHVRCHLGSLGLGSRCGGSPRVRIPRRLLGRPFDVCPLTARFPTGDILTGGVQPGGILTGFLRAGFLRAGILRAHGIRAGGIRAGGIRAGGIRAGGIRAGGIRAGDIREGGTQVAGMLAVVERMPSGFRLAGGRLSE